MNCQDPTIASQNIAVFCAHDFRVTNGANLGDALSVSEELSLDDTYVLSSEATEHALALSTEYKPPYRIGQSTEIGKPGHLVHLDCCLTFMASDGSVIEALTLVEVDQSGDVANVYLMPLAALDPKLDYALVGKDDKAARQKFAQAACVGFARGTMITMASGAQKPVEQLTLGDTVLTRDAGPQSIRWIGQVTTRAVGAFAPILIKADTLNNINDLLVSPDHRLFVFQRSDRLGAGRSELLVRAKHLVNGDTVTIKSGGHVDYFQMLFDHHQIIFAEGIAAESMLVDPRTSAALPDEISDDLTELTMTHLNSDRPQLNVQKGLLNRPDAAELLKKSSSH